MVPDNCTKYKLNTSNHILLRDITTNTHIIHEKWPLLKFGTESNSILQASVAHGCNDGT